MPRRTATLEDVARAAGVSQQTVSRVLNRPEVVSARTREQVIRAMQALHYVPNRSAETNTSESFVRRADQFAKGVDAGETVVNGFRDVVLAGEAKVSDYEIASIATCPEQERKQLVEELLKPKEKSEPRKNKKQSEAEESFSEPEIVATYDIAAEIPLQKVNDPTDEADIEDSILDSMSGTVSMFISSCNNYFARFPKLQTEKRYKDRALEILGVAKKFVMDVEGVLK